MTATRRQCMRPAVAARVAATAVVQEEGRRWLSCELAEARPLGRSREASERQQASQSARGAVAAHAGRGAGLLEES